MRRTVHWVVAMVIIGHGLIHLLGVVKGFAWADVEQLREPISTAMAVAWLAASLLVIAAGILFAVRVRWWWIVGAVAALASQAVVVSSWADAKAGTVANLILVIAVVLGFMAERPSGLRSRFRDHRTRQLAQLEPVDPDAAGMGVGDLAHLPPVVARYISASGLPGQPRATAFRASIHGRIRSGPDDPWMTWCGEQVNTYGSSPSRVFYMDATMRGVPADVLHVYEGSTATMQVKALSMFGVVDAKGPEMDQAETVTLLNDMCILAPSALVDAPIVWTELDAHRVRADYTNAGHSVSAELVFDASGDLVDFVSDDRFRTMPDATMMRERWSTPLANYRDFAGRRIAASGRGRWHPDGDTAFDYLEFRVDDITFLRPSIGR